MSDRSTAPGQVVVNRMYQIPGPARVDLDLLETRQEGAVTILRFGVGK